MDIGQAGRLNKATVRGPANVNYSHGHRSEGLSATYSSWQSMLNRCRNPGMRAYLNYGGAGISVCARWHNFEHFLADMGERPAGTSIDRIDNARGYEPGNCRWANKYQQANNRRTNRVLTLDGTSKTLANWARVVGLPRKTIAMRLQDGWTVEAALSRPLRKQRNNVMTEGMQVRIAFGRLKGKLGEIVKIEGGVYTVRHASGASTFRARELEAI